MSKEMAHIYSQEIGPEKWETSGPLTLNFTRSLATPQGKTLLVPAGMITSEDTQLGVAISRGEGALGVILPDCPIPDQRVEELYREGVERSEESEINWVDALQAGWIMELAGRIRDEFFMEDRLSPPTVQFEWNREEWSKSRIVRAEMIMKGIPNGHPLWILATPSPDVGYDSFDL